jgi:hypothetical protein
MLFVVKATKRVITRPPRACQTATAVVTIGGLRNQPKRTTMDEQFHAGGAKIKLKSQRIELLLCELWYFFSCAFA